MSKGGRKGRVPNQLVAASCAAILAVYAAGYWRTRDEARRLDNASQARRPVRAARPVKAAPVVPVPAAILAAPEASPEATPLVARSTAEKKAPGSVVVSASSPALAPEPTNSAESPMPPAAAQAAAVAPATTPLTPVDSPWHDGIYTGWGLSRHGDIEARVTIKNGGIVAVGIATCATRYPCYVIDEILQQPLFRQSADVDRVSRATESSDAYSDAVWQALQKAEAGPAATAPPSP